MRLAIRFVVASTFLLWGACGGDGRHGACDEAGACAPRCQPGCESGEVCSENGVCLGSVAWRYARPGRPGLGRMQIVVEEDGTVLFVSVEKDESRASLFALSPDGQLLWMKEIETTPFAGAFPDVPSTPVLGPDGTVYVSKFGELLAIAPDGQERWRAPRPSQTTHGNESAAVGVDGTVYWGIVAALNAADGSVRWKRGGSSRNDVTIFPFSAERTFLPAGLSENGSVALGPDGDVAWTMNDDEMGDQIAVISNQTFARVMCRGPREDPTVASACTDVGLFGIEDGQPRWIWRAVQNNFPIIDLLAAPDGTILVRASDSATPGTTVLWRLDAMGRMISHPVSVGLDAYGGAALGDDGILYVSRGPSSTRKSGGVVALDPDSGDVMWNFERPGLVFPGFPAVGARGCVLVGIDDEAMDTSEVLCLRSASKGLAASPWPSTRGGNHGALRPMN